jgi:hypothetical protein
MLSLFKKRPPKGPERVNLKFLCELFSKWYGRKVGWGIFVFEVGDEIASVDFFHNTTDTRKAACLIMETLKAQEKKEDAA